MDQPVIPYEQVGTLLLFSYVVLTDDLYWGELNGFSAQKETVF